MRRHEKPRSANIRVAEPIKGDWCNLSLAEKRTHIFNQAKSLGSLNKQPQITCLCRKVVPILYAYRCFECGAFWCPKCAKVHFSEE